LSRFWAHTRFTAVTSKRLHMAAFPRLGLRLSVMHFRPRASHDFYRRYVPAGKFHGQGCPMKCNTVRTKLGVISISVTAGPQREERVQISATLEGAAFAARSLNASASSPLCFRVCPGTFRLPISPCASGRCRSSAAFAGLAHPYAPHQGSRRILLDNVLRPLTVPATGGFFSAILVFVLVLQHDRAGHYRAAPSRTTWLSI